MMFTMTSTEPRPGDEAEHGLGPRAERQFGWQDMFVGPDADPRGIGGIFVHHGDERTTGEDAPARYRQSAGDDHDRAFRDAVADPAAVALAWENWRAEVAFAERFVADTADLGLTKPYVGRGGHAGQVSLREVLVHMIEEYARHVGHADLLREGIDGRVGL